MGSGVQARAAPSRLAAPFGARAPIGPANPWSGVFAGTGIALGSDFPEIDCVRARFDRAVIDAAERRAAALGVGADRVLIAAGRITEDDYLRALADALGVTFEPLDGAPRAYCPLNDERLIESAAAGLLPLAVDGELYLVVAPRGLAARTISGMIADNPAQAGRFRFTSSERLNRFALRYTGKTIAARATTSLQKDWPMLCAGPPRWRTNFVSVAIGTLLVLVATVMKPGATVLAIEVMLAAMFLAWLALRLSGVFIGAHPSAPAPRTADDALPVYTIIAALYHEAASVDGLLAAIERLDYPGIMAQTPQAI